MCQTLPGPRCYADSSKKLVRVIERRDAAADTVAQIEEQLKTVRSPKDLSNRKRTLAKLSKAQTKLAEENLAVSHTQRDIDGTRTGLKALECELKDASNDIERARIQRRINVAKALRVARSHALARATEKSRPVLNFRAPANKAA